LSNSRLLQLVTLINYLGTCPKTREYYSVIVSQVAVLDSSLEGKLPCLSKAMAP
jgi:hypothetical protein